MSLLFSTSVCIDLNDHGPYALQTCSFWLIWHFWFSSFSLSSPSLTLCVCHCLLLLLFFEGGHLKKCYNMLVWSYSNKPLYSFYYFLEHTLQKRELLKNILVRTFWISIHLAKITSQKVYTISTSCVCDCHFPTHSSAQKVIVLLVFCHINGRKMVSHRCLNFSFLMISGVGQMLYV
jgi:hypothetical protein